MRRRPIARTWTYTFEPPPSKMWPALADTQRFNEAALLPKHEIEERPQPDGSVQFFATAKMGGFVLAWRDEPPNWVTNRWFEHRRAFTQGPFEELNARLEMEPSGTPHATGTIVRYTLEVVPAGTVGRAILELGFFKETQARYDRLFAQAHEHVRGEREQVYEVRPPQLAKGARERAESLASRLAESRFGHGLAPKLLDYVLHRSDVDVARMRPLQLAREWAVSPRESVEACLQAAAIGLLGVRWALLCPRCRVGKSIVAALDELPSGTHCPTCNIDYQRNYGENVELSFCPASAIRPVVAGEWCLLGPMSTPHIHVQMAVGPGESTEIGASLAAGRYRLRTLEPGPELELDWPGGAFPGVVIGPENVSLGPLSPRDRVTLTNRKAHRVVVLIESREWLKDVLTAHRATTFQAFRELFPGQILRPSDDARIDNAVFLFTDLKGSTQLYQRIGESAAYHLVREFFAIIGKILRENNGAIVKMIGDGIHASFFDPIDAVRAAIAAQRAVRDHNAAGAPEPITTRIGINGGSCVAVTLNGRLDYYGTAVNLAARLEGLGYGGDVVLSAEIAADHVVAALLSEYSTRAESASLKGFEATTPIVRILNPTK